MNTSKGFISLGILLAILAMVVVGGGAYYAMQNQTTPTLPPQEQATTTPMTTETSKTTTTVTTTTQSPPTPTCTGRDHRAPYILSITPSAGPVGTKATISGCNLSGFEGDLTATFVRSDGAIIPLNGGHYSRKTPDIAEPTSMTVTVQTYCPTGSEVGAYSGKDTPCKTVEATPGTYTVYVETPERGGSKSNTVTFTVN